MKSPENWMRIALDLAQKAALADEVPVGAILVYDDQIIGSGANQREVTHRTIAHAEIIALEDFSSRSRQWRLPSKTQLYTTAEPCMMCTGALLSARVSDVYFGCSDPRGAGLLIQVPLIEKGVFDHKFNKIVSGILEIDCASLMTNYFKKKRS